MTTDTGIPSEAVLIEQKHASAEQIRSLLKQNG
jgi:hypothetical protein